MSIWGFWRKKTREPDCDSAPSSPQPSGNNTISASQFLSDVQESLPTVNRTNLRRLIIGIPIFIALLCLAALLVSLLHHVGNLEQWGYVGVFVANFVSSMGVIIGIPAGATVTIAVAGVQGPLLVGIVAGVGATLGEFTAYWFGYGGERFLRFKGYHQYAVAERWMGRYGGLTIVFFAFVPFFMFDFVGIAAGALRYPFKRFLIFCLIGRIPRCLIEAYAGKQFVDFIMPHLPHWISGPFVD